MRSKKVLILGGSSDIGKESIKIFLNNNWQVTSHYNSKKINNKDFYKNNNFSQFKFNLKNIFSLILSLFNSIE